MQNLKTTVKWQQGMAFNVSMDGHSFTIDASPEVGGQNLGPRPKGLMLAALAGCTGMDVVSILAKMKVEGFTFDLNVGADMSEDHPKVYTNIYLDYIFNGDNLPVEKIKKAVNLSEERYCGVSAMLKQAATLKSRILINNEVIQ